MEPDVREVFIGRRELGGYFGRPGTAQGIVIFAHGSGSGRMSPRNRHVAAALRRAGYATLLFDLLTKEEERFRTNVYDISLQAARMGEATEWARAQPETADLPVGYFGDAMGAGAALMAAALDQRGIAAVVSCGGRPDLAGALIDNVNAPTLLIAGSLDAQVIELSRYAYERLSCEKQLAIVPGAGHLFEEPGALDRLEALAVEWFARHLHAPGATTSPK